MYIKICLHKAKYCCNRCAQHALPLTIQSFLVSLGALTEGLQFLFPVPNGITPQNSHNKELVGQVKELNINTRQKIYTLSNITPHFIRQVYKNVRHSVNM